MSEHIIEEVNRRALSFVSNFIDPNLLEIARHHSFVVCSFCDFLLFISAILIAKLLSCLFGQKFAFIFLIVDCRLLNHLKFFRNIQFIFSLSNYLVSLTVYLTAVLYLRKMERKKEK